MVKISRNPSDEHEFHTMGSRPFEHFVRALHEAQPGILTAYLYGPDGQGQFGADHIATRNDGAADIEIGQSKAYRQFGQTKIREAADAFLDRWDAEWSSKQVKRFILFVGCAIKSRQAADEIIAQTQRFAALGVEFLVWAANAIYDHLSAAPHVVRTHLGQEWYEKLFGEPVGPLTGLQQDLQRGDMGAFRVAAYVSRLNQAESAEVVELRRRARRGEATQVNGTWYKSQVPATNVDPSGMLRRQFPLTRCGPAAYLPCIRRRADFGPSAYRQAISDSCHQGSDCQFLLREASGSRI